MNSNRNYIANREYKSTVFSKLFGEDKENALSLYNAVNNSNYTNADDLIFTTLEDVVYMKMKNDVSFLFDKTLSLYEHQSTYNPNMPLRGFLYFADLYRQLIKDNERIYSKNIVKIPAPRYIVFYNGNTKDMPESVKELHLSDAFDMPVEQGKFEWTATLININTGMNPELLKKCKALGGYVTFVDKVRNYSKSMSLTEAVNQAVDECVEDGVLEGFFNKHRREVRNMVLTEFDEEKFLKMVRAEERAAGHKAGLAEGERNLLIKILSDLGPVSKELQSTIQNSDDVTLKKWTKLASKAESMQEFLEQIK